MLQFHRIMHSLVSTNFVYAVLACIMVYFLVMDTVLIGKARTRGSYRPLSTTSTNVLYSSTPGTVTSKTSCGIFSPLTVKKIMIADATHYIRSPIAEFIEAKLHFSEYLPFISANTISLFHCVLSVVSMKFLIHQSLSYRQIGVCIFQFRNLLDSFDGVIYRVHAKKQVYKSYYGSFGYFFDAVSDVFGGVCLTVAIGIYLLKNPPQNMHFNRCFRLTSYFQGLLTKLPFFANSVPLSSSDPEMLLPVHCRQAKSQKSGNDFSSRLLGTYWDRNTLPSNIAIIFAVCFVGLRLGISAVFWDRSVKKYEELLDSTPTNVFQEELQINTLGSSITLFIMFLWRIMCALSLQDCLLIAIFIDKIWEFIVKTQYLGWFMLLALIILTELHVSEIQLILSESMNHSFKTVRL